MILGVTGKIGAGKSTLCQNLVAYLQACGISAFHLDADTIRRQLSESQQSSVASLRESFHKFLQCRQEKWIFFEWAMLLEQDLIDLIDGPILIVDTTFEHRKKKTFATK